MANIKITDLTAYTDAASTDVLPIVDVGADVTKKITIGNVVKAVPLGTAALPGLAFDGDPNTGIYSPGGDQVAISTNGTTSLFIDSSGEISTRTNGVIRGGSSAGSLTLIGGATNQGGKIVLNGGNVDGNIIFYAQQFTATPAERLRITSTGTLMHLGAGNSTTPAVQFNGSAPVNSLVMDSSGRVGLGTSSPGRNMSIIDSSGPILELGTNNSAASASIYLHESTTGGTANGGGIVYDGVNNKLNIVCGTTINTPRITVDRDTGAVGIGTTNPDRLLHLAGADTAIIRLENTDSSLVADQIIGGLEFEKTDGSGAGVGVVGGLRMYSEGSVGESAYLTLSTASSSGNDIERLRINASGNVGIGTTAAYNRLYIQDSNTGEQLTIRSTSGNAGVAGLRFSIADNSVTTDVNSKASILFVGSNTGNARGSLTFNINNVNNSTNVSTSDERMRLDGDGRLLVGTSTARENFYNSTLSAAFQVEGTSSPGTDRRIAITSSSTDANGGQIVLAKQKSGSLGGNTVVLANDQCGAISFQGSDGTQFVESARIEGVVDGTPGANDMPGRLVFSTTAATASSPTERMRIGSTGAIQTFSTDNSHSFRSNRTLSTEPIVVVRNNASSVSDGTTVFKVMADGDVENTNNSYTGISDIKLKENIVDANSQWSDLKALQVRNYNFKAETGYNTHTQIGLIAQEVELVSPGLVGETIDDETGEATKSVNYSVLYMKAVKALQEAMERIEVLEAKVATLEGV